MEDIEEEEYIIEETLPFQITVEQHPEINPQFEQFINEFVLHPTNSKNVQKDYNQTTSRLSFISTQHIKDTISSDYFSPWNKAEVQELKSIARSSDFVDRLAMRMSLFPKFSAKQEVSELAMRTIHSTIVEFVYHILQNKYPDYDFELLANQCSISDAAKKPDNMINVTIADKKFVLLLGEDKPNLKSDHDKLTELVRTEVQKSVRKLLKCGATSVDDYSPILYETNCYIFSLYKFNKLLDIVDEKSFIANENRTILINLYTSNDKLYDLRNIKDVYYAICAIVGVLQRSIDFIVRNMKKNGDSKSELLETPAHGTPSLASFTLFSDTYHYMHGYNLKTANFELSDGDIFTIKYVNKAEANLVKRAMQISSKTIPAKIGWFEKRQIAPHDAILCMKRGYSLRRPQKLSEIDNIFQQLLQGLVDYHTHNFIHRDIKPDNLVLFKKELKIIDFGLSVEFKYERDHVAYDFHDMPIGLCVGTEGFVAPEIRMKQHYGTKIDCYSAGATMISILAVSVDQGLRFKENSNLNEKNVDQFFEEYHQLKKYQTVIIRLLEQRPEQRWSAQEALHCLMADTSKKRSIDEISSSKTTDDVEKLKRHKVEAHLTDHTEHA